MCSRVSRLLLLIAFSLFTGTVLPLQAADRDKDSKLPNIVLMMTDDQGWGEVGYYGHPYVKTPVLDEMAAKGLRFDRFYAAAPVCTPTRTSIITGRHPVRSGSFHWDWSTRAEEISLAQLLKDNGYRTAHFGKWHIGAIKKGSPVSPGGMGFDEYLSHDNFFETDPDLSRNGEAPAVFEGEGSEVVVQEALKFARKVHAEGKPFFIVIWFGSPHVPYVASKEDSAPYREQGLGKEVSDRFAEITAMDRAVGQFRTALDKMGVRDNTLLWFNSDNGISRVGIPQEQVKHTWNGGLRGKKGDLTEGGLRVPAIIEWPAVIKQGRITQTPAVTTDIMPTLLDVIGVSYPDPDRPLDGISLKPLIDGKEMAQRPVPIPFWVYDFEPERENEPWLADNSQNELITFTARQKAKIKKDEYQPRYFANHKHPQARTSPIPGKAALIDGNMKLLLLDNGKSPELYNLETDPQEKSNLAKDKPTIVEKMTRALRAWQESAERSLTGADYKD